MDDSLYIHNAGLVILAPYFNRFFTMLDMLDGKEFIDEEAAVRAVLLLEYLASGQTESPEHRLAFNKVLCGLPINTPVPESIELSEQEIEVSAQLLNAILQNWDKMSSSTVDNLRASFLLRDGRLLDQPDNWSLTVENKGFDILLSFLPWTISLVSLPWMAKRLEVSWNTQIS